MTDSTKRIFVGPKFLNFINIQLNTLRGYDLLALEMLQNADDAKADEISFDIRDDAFIIQNNSKFSSCEDRSSTEECTGLGGNSKKVCDWHAFIDIASGNKPNLEDELIGRFGLGFTSVYQITDRPVITCDGTQLTIYPEDESGEYKNVPNKPGTSFKLPWAFDATTTVRKKLSNTEVLDKEDIEKILNVVADGLEQALLFIKNVKKISILRNSILVQSFEIEDINLHEKRIISGPKRKEQRWYFASSNSSYELTKLVEEFPRQIGNFPRRHKVEIAIPISNVEMNGGLLFAFLPTQKNTGINVHINADFFPQPSRTDINFNDIGRSDPQAIWNATLIASAAKLLASNSEKILALLGATKFWEIVRTSQEIKNRALENNALVPRCYANFWQEFEKNLPGMNVVPSEEDPIVYRKLEEIVIPDGENLKIKRKVMTEIGLHPLSGNLSAFKDLIETLGAEKLNLEKLVTALEKCNWVDPKKCDQQLRAGEFEIKYRPIWMLINECLPKEINGLIVPNLIKKLMPLAIIVTRGNEITSLDKSVIVQESVDFRKVLDVFQTTRVIMSEVEEYSKLAGICNKFSLIHFASELQGLLATKDLQSAKALCQNIYQILIQMCHNKNISPEELQLLSDLAIWPSKSGSLISRHQGKILGAFNDPLSQANLFDMEKLEGDVRNFLENKNKLNAETLSIKNYILEILPEIFSSESNDIEPSKYRALLIELANHPSVLDDETIIESFSSMSFVPSSGGKFRIPSSVVFPDSKFAHLVGNRFNDWADLNYLPESKRVNELLTRIGVQKHPTPSQVISVWESIVEERINVNASRQVVGILGYINELRASWDKEDLENNLKRIITKHCLPAVGDNTSWHIPSNLYSPEFSSIFSTQREALVLDIDSGSREFLTFVCEELGVKSEPEVKLVIKNIARSHELKLKINAKTYNFLNRVAKRNLDADSRQILETLRDKPIYYFGEDKYIKPADLYFDHPKINSPWAYQVSKELLQYEDLLKITGVKTQPDSVDFLRILLEIAEPFLSEPELKITSADIDVYFQCWQQLNLLNQQELIPSNILNMLKSEAIFMTKTHAFKSSYEVLIQDSDWFQKEFEGKFDEHLIEREEIFKDILLSLGIPLVSQSIVSVRGDIGGERIQNFSVQKILHDRRDCIGVILEGLEKNFNRNRIWKGIQVYSVERVSSVWKLNTNSGSTKSIHKVSSVYLDIDKSELYISGIDSSDNLDLHWTTIIREMLHQLLPAIEENNIRNAISSFDSVIQRAPGMARKYLMELGYSFDEKEVIPEFIPSVSEVLNSLGSGASDNDERVSEIAAQEALAEVAETAIAAPIDDATLRNTQILEVGNESEDISEVVGGQRQDSSSPEEPLDSVKRNHSAKNIPEEGSASRATRTSNQAGPPSSDGSFDTERGQYQRPARFEDNLDSKRLILNPVSNARDIGKSAIEDRQQREIANAYIYVSNSTENEGNPERRARAMENEKLSRDYVIEHESSEGRIAEPMSETNEGYDIESLEGESSGELRFIEVKSLSGYWGDEGVSISIKQLEWAYKKGDNYWIYIVENVGNEKRKLYKIQDPAKYIRAFKFNKAWKEIAESREIIQEIGNDISNAISEEDIGFEIWHTMLGRCFLIEWIPMGIAIKVKLLFDGDDFPKEFSFNPRTMKKING